MKSTFFCVLFSAFVAVLSASLLPLSSAFAVNCTHRGTPCNTYQNWWPGGICCLNAGGFQTGRGVESGEQKTVVVATGQCGNKRKSTLLPCSSNIGACGGTNYSPDCF